MGLSAPGRSPSDAPRHAPHTHTHDALVHEIGLGVATLFLSSKAQEGGRRHRSRDRVALGPDPAAGPVWIC